VLLTGRDDDFTVILKGAAATPSLSPTSPMTSRPGSAADDAGGHRAAPTPA
jgi:hypothetical protein